MAKIVKEKERGGRTPALNACAGLPPDPVREHVTRHFAF